MRVSLRIIPLFKEKILAKGCKMIIICFAIS